MGKKFNFLEKNERFVNELFYVCLFSLINWNLRVIDDFFFLGLIEFDWNY